MQRDGGPGPGGGPGGGGNPTGEFTGTSLGLELIGNHAYAFSGEVVPGGAGAADTTMLSFKTGTYYLVAELSWQNDASSSADEFYNFTLNGATIFNARYANAVDASNDQPYTILLPPYSEFEVKMGTTGASKMTCTLVGRIYRG